MLLNRIWEGHAFGLGRKHDEITREDLVAGDDAWVANVLCMVPPAHLLEFCVQDGWTPLCMFLKVKACPMGDFLHVNNKTMLLILIRVLQTINCIWPVFLLLLVYLCGPARRATWPNPKKIELKLELYFFSMYCTSIEIHTDKVH
jgi:hypothetical protein